MINNEKLIKLISSLTPNEKRFYQIQSQKLFAKGKNKYLQLFEILSTKQEITDYYLMHKLKTKNVSRLRHYLYFDILDTIKNYETDDRKIELIKQLHSIRFLFYKNLHNQIVVLLEQAIANAFEIQDWSILLDLLHLKKTFIALRYYPQQPNIRSEVYQLEQNILHYREQENELWYKSSSMLVSMHKFQYNAIQEEMQQIDAIANSYPLNLPIKDIYSTLAKNHYHFFWSLYNHLHRNKEKVFWHTECIVELSKLNKASVLSLLSVYNNYFFYCLYYQNFNKSYYEFLNEVEQLTAKSKIVEGLKFRVFYSNAFDEINILRDWKRLQKTGKLFEREWEKISEYTAFSYVAYPIYAYIHGLLYYGSFDICLDKMKYIFEHEEEHNQDKLFTSLKLIELLCWFEKSEFQYLQSLMTQAKRYISKKEKWTKENQLFYKVLKQHIRKAKPNKALFYKDLLEKLQEISEKQPREDGGGFYFKLQEWCKFKTT